MRNPFSSKSRGVRVVAPCAGELIDLSAIPDPVFANRTLGDGFAVETAAGTICSPVDGALVLVAGTGHAFAVRADGGAEVLVHIGVDTVVLRGEGFEPLASAGQRVNAGEPVVRVDLARVRPDVPSLATCVVVTNHHPITIEPGADRVATIRPPR